MNKQQDHTIAVAVTIVIGILITLTIGILSLVYTHESDIKRDEYYAEHCSVVDYKTTSYGDGNITKFNCSSDNE